MGRWLAPLLGVVGLLALLGGIVWTELDKVSMGGVAVVGSGVVLVVVAGGLAAVIEGLTRYRNPLPRR